MATRFWVGGTGTWDAVTTTNWAALSGGAGGQSVPGASDDVTFDASSGGGTVTVNTNFSVISLTMGAFTGTLDFSANNNSPTLQTFSGTGSGVRTLNMGNGTWSLSAITGTLWDMTVTTNLTFNANSSTINTTGALSGTNSMNFGSLTYSTVTYNIKRGITTTISGSSPTFATLSILQAAAANGTNLVNPTLATNLTVTSSLVVTGATAANNRVIIVSSTVGTARTITAQAVTLTNVTFQDIIGAGNATWSGTSIGDGGGNTGISFTAPVTRYAVAAGNWSTTATWSASDGGGSGASVPLPQDTAIINGNSGVGTIACDEVFMSSTNCTGYTGTLSITQNLFQVCGSLILASGMTFTSTAVQILFSGRATHTLTSAGKIFTGSTGITFQTVSGSYTVSDNLVVTAAIALSSGTLITNSSNVTCASFSASGSTTRALTMNSTTWTMNGTGTVWNMGTTTALTFSAGTSTIVLTNNSASTKTFAGGSLIYNNFRISTAGSGTTTLSGNNTFNNMEIDAGRTVIFTAATTTTLWTFTAIGQAGSNITLQSTSGTNFILSKSSGLVACNQLTISDSTAQGGAIWYAGANSTDGGGGNIGWVFGNQHQRLIPTKSLRSIISTTRTAAGTRTATSARTAV